MNTKELLQRCLEHIEDDYELTEEITGRLTTIEREDYLEEIKKAGEEGLFIPSFNTPYYWITDVGRIENVLPQYNPEYAEQYNKTHKNIKDRNMFRTLEEAREHLKKIKL